MRRCVILCRQTVLADERVEIRHGVGAHDARIICIFLKHNHDVAEGRIAAARSAGYGDGKSGGSFVACAVRHLNGETGRARSARRSGDSAASGSERKTSRKAPAQHGPSVRSRAAGGLQGGGIGRLHLPVRQARSSDLH